MVKFTGGPSQTEQDLDELLWSPYSTFRTYLTRLSLNYLCPRRDPHPTQGQDAADAFAACIVSLASASIKLRQLEIWWPVRMEFPDVTVASLVTNSLPTLHVLRVNVQKDTPETFQAISTSTCLQVLDVSGLSRDVLTTCLPSPPPPTSLQQVKLRYPTPVLYAWLSPCTQLTELSIEIGEGRELEGLVVLLDTLPIKLSIRLQLFLCSFMNLFDFESLIVAVNDMLQTRHASNIVELNLPYMDYLGKERCRIISSLDASKLTHLQVLKMSFMDWGELEGIDYIVTTMLKIPRPLHSEEIIFEFWDPKYSRNLEQLDEILALYVSCVKTAHPLKVVMNLGRDQEVKPMDFRRCLELGREIQQFDFVLGT